MDATEPLLVALSGLLVVAGILLRSVLDRLAIPALVGYLALGFGVRVADGRWPFLPQEGFVVLEFLGHLGVIALLFRVGLESHVGKLIKQLGRAGPIWGGSVLVSGLAGYAAARWVLHWSLVPSLFTAVALTATSVGVSLGVWREMDALRGDTGALLIDTVELDDFSGVVLMSLLFGIAPLLHGGTEAGLVGSILETSGVVLLKAALFLGLCVLFARYANPGLMRIIRPRSTEPRRILAIAGAGIIIAAVAEVLGFSYAIGAFFAGLVFSREPDAVKLDTSFEEIYALFVPFFFIWLGFGVRPYALTSALGAAAVLCTSAIIGKIVGTALPALPALGRNGALALGVSVVPRAEIAMVVMERGRQLGDWAVPADLFAAMLLVTLATCAVFPVVSRRLLEAWPEVRGAA